MIGVLTVLALAITILLLVVHTKASWRSIQLEGTPGGFARAVITALLLLLSIAAAGYTFFLVLTGLGYIDLPF